MIGAESDLVKAMGRVIIHHSFALAFFCAGNSANAVLQHLKLGGKKTYCRSWDLVNSYTKVRVKVTVIREDR